MRVVALAATGAERALHHFTFTLQAQELLACDVPPEAEALAQLIEREWRVRTRKAQDKVAQRIANRREQRLRQARWQYHTERIAVTRGVFHRDVRSEERRVGKECRSR